MDQSVWIKCGSPVLDTYCISSSEQFSSVPASTLLTFALFSSQVSSHRSKTSVFEGELFDYQREKTELLRSYTFHVLYLPFLVCGFSLKLLFNFKIIYFLLLKSFFSHSPFIFFTNIHCLIFKVQINETIDRHNIIYLNL